MDNYSYTPCEQNGLNIGTLSLELHVLKVEQGSVIPSSKNATSFWTIFTLTCSSLGIALSAAALLLLILTALLFAEWRKSYKNQLLIQFMLARLFYSSVRFFSDVQDLFKVCPATDSIIFLEFFSLIYSEMVLISWMFVFSRQMYISLVKVFATENFRIWTVSVCTWLAPAAVSLLLHQIFYLSPDTNSKYYTMYMMLIKWPVLIANAVLLILVLRSILINNKKTENNVRIVVVMIMLIFVFCFQQILIDVCKILFVKVFDGQKSSILVTGLVVFNILSMYHCAFSIVFWVLGNANTRQLWKFQGRDLRSELRLSS